MKKIFSVVVFLLVSIGFSFATHNRAGEITYRHIQGYEYEVTITTYTNTGTGVADKCILTLELGDGTTQDITRSNGPMGASCNEGEYIGNNVKLNKYITRHTYPGPGYYRIRMTDPMRNAGVVNIPNSVNIPFFLETELFIYAQTEPNNSPELNFPPIDNACLYQIFYHNPGAVDMDIVDNLYSDSLVYSIIASRELGGLVPPGYSFPDDIYGNDPNATNIMTIDSITGTMTWDSPQKSGEYNVAILIEEYRKVNGVPLKVGSVVRDIQINVLPDCTQELPYIITPADTCVNAGSSLQHSITAVDPNNERIKLEATGDAFLLQNSPATFPPVNGTSSVTGTFDWSPLIEHVKKDPYNIVFKASQYATTGAELVTFANWQLQVVGPPIQNLEAISVGNKTELSWVSYAGVQHIQQINVYRKIDSTGWVPDHCEIGVPAYTGYQYIGSTSANATGFIDDNNGAGLSVGKKYCYLVAAQFEEDYESYASNEACTELKREVAIPTHVSILTTGFNTGRDSVVWINPTQINDTLFPGPYQYLIYRSVQLGGYSLVGSSNTASDFDQLDTIWVEDNLNTRDNQYSYKIELLSNGESVGESASASSVYLNSTGLDNRVQLNWNADVPWNNYFHYILKLNDLGEYDTIAITETNTYTDSNLVNGKTYCYKVITQGRYSGTLLPDSLFNHSQSICEMAEDNQAPCDVPGLTVSGDCEIGRTVLSWDNPNIACDTTDDVVSYNVYYKATLQDTFSLIESVFDPTITEIVFENQESIAGCYTVTAIDSFDNESFVVDSVCLENCPVYELPNVITPNGDGMNDYFVPFPYRHVRSIDLQIYNRWGGLVFETNNPDVMWDGYDMNTNLPVSQGVYFYTCKVNEVRLAGLVPVYLKGTVTIMSPTNNNKE